jgi:hypothetical protein
MTTSQSVLRRLPPGPFVFAHALPTHAKRGRHYPGPHDRRGPAVELRSPTPGEVIGELPTSTPADVEVVPSSGNEHRLRGPLGLLESGLGCCSISMIICWISATTHRPAAVGRQRPAECCKRGFSCCAHWALLRADRTPLSALRAWQRDLAAVTRVDRHYVPKGLVGLIGPWNYPLTIAMSDGRLWSRIMRSRSSSHTHACSATPIRPAPASRLDPLGRRVLHPCRGVDLATRPADHTGPVASGDRQQATPSNPRIAKALL